ncbi:hypothetical protein Tco_0982035 [Tanacetum coccineum]
MVAYLERPTYSDDFTEIVDFLNVNPIRNLDSLSAKFLMYPRFLQVFLDIQRLEAEQVSGNITKTRSKATLNEPTPQGTGSGSGPRRQDTMGDIIALTRFKNVSKTSYDSPLRGVNTPRNLETTKTAQAKEITSLKKRVKKLEQRGRSRTSGLKRLYKVGTSRRVESSAEASLGDQEVASKQGRNIAEIDSDVDISLDMADQEVNVAEKEVSAADPVTTVSEVVTTASVDISIDSVLITVSTSTPTTPLTTTTKDDMTLAETLMEIKSAKPKPIGVVMQEPSEIPRISATQPQFQEKAQGSRDKGKAKMVEEEKLKEPTNRKDQIKHDEELAKRLEAQL